MASIANLGINMVNPMIFVQMGACTLMQVSRGLGDGSVFIGLPDLFTIKHLKFRPTPASTRVSPNLFWATLHVCSLNLMIIPH